MDIRWTINGQSAKAERKKNDVRTKEERSHNGDRTEVEPNNLDYDNKVIGVRIEVVHQLRKLCYNKYYS